LTVSILSIGLAASRSWRTAQRQKEATGALAAGGRQPRDPDEIRAHRDGGQPGDLAVMVRGELQEAAAVGAQGVSGRRGFVTVRLQACRAFTSFALGA
jgi:hypothetical protein